jgi:GlpG protein
MRGNGKLREIGTLPKENDPKVFADYLLTMGIIGRAAEELKSYLNRPDDPRFQAAVDAAAAIRRQEQVRDKAFRKNYREVSDLWAHPTLGRHPLTITLISICVFIFLWQSQSTGRVRYYLSFATLRLDQGQLRDDGFQGILHGEPWRLVTPIFLHMSIMHLVFNMWWLRDLGTLIEMRRGTLRLAVLIVIAAVASNIAQYLWMERTNPGQPHLFGGMSGVVYALFGFIWMKGQYQPEQGMILHPNTITIMLLWLVICMTGSVGPIANAAHFMGLVSGVAFGVLRY